MARKDERSTRLGQAFALQARHIQRPTQDSAKRPCTKLLNASAAISVPFCVAYGLRDKRQDIGTDDGYYRVE